MCNAMVPVTRKVGMTQITASRALFIKQGEGGRWEKSSIQGGEIRFGYQEIPHEICQSGNWEEARRIESKHCDNQGALARHINQVREFYTADESVMWITFYAGRLWWCFAESGVSGVENNEKVRKVKGQWHDMSAEGKTLWKREISGKLLAIEKFGAPSAMFLNLSTCYTKSMVLLSPMLK